MTDSQTTALLDRYTISTFVQGTTNSLTYDVCRQVRVTSLNSIDYSSEDSIIIINSNSEHSNFKSPGMY